MDPVAKETFVYIDYFGNISQSITEYVVFSLSNHFCKYFFV